MKQTPPSLPAPATPLRPKVLNHHASKMAEQLYFLYQRAYRQEAGLIGGRALSSFAPLQRSAAQIRLAPGRVMGLETPAGDIIAAIEFTEPGPQRPWCHIDGLCVDPSHQRRGHATRLLRALLKAYQQRAQSLRVQASVANAPALALYRQLGFRPAGRQMQHGLEVQLLELPL